MSKNLYSLPKDLLIQLLIHVEDYDKLTSEELVNKMKKIKNILDKRQRLEESLYVIQKLLELKENVRFKHIIEPNLNIIDQLECDLDEEYYFIFFLNGKQLRLENNNIFDEDGHLIENPLVKELLTSLGFEIWYDKYVHPSF